MRVGGQENFECKTANHSRLDGGTVMRVILMCPGHSAKKRAIPAPNNPRSTIAVSSSGGVSRQRFVSGKALAAGVFLVHESKNTGG
jgi:hypothetical protein